MAALISRRKRQEKTLALVQARRITTQDKLLHLLQRAGVPATQSSVSRDLEELGIVKHRGFYRLPQVPDGASAVAVEIDRARISEIAGTIAGDDTIFVALVKPNLQRTATRKIWEVFG